MLHLQDLTEAEKLRIAEVLERDLELQKAQERVLLSLKQEIDEKRAIKALTTPLKAVNTCLLCGLKFHFLIRAGVVCSKCYLKVCRKCSQRLHNNLTLCVGCFKERQYLCKSGDWIYCQQRGVKKRAENESSDENDYKPTAKAKPSVSQVILGELRKTGVRGSTKSLSRIDEISSTDATKQPGQPQMGWKTLSHIVLFQSFGASGGSKDVGGHTVRRVSTSRYKSSSSEEDDIAEQEVVKAKRAKSAGRVHPMRWNSEKYPDKSQVAVANKKESSRPLGPFGLRTKAATLRVTATKESQKDTKVSRRPTEINNQTQIVITSPKAARRMSSGRAKTGESDSDFTTKSGSGEDGKTLLTAGSGGSSVDRSPSPSGLPMSSLVKNHLYNSNLSLKSCGSMTSLYSGGGYSSYATSITGFVELTLLYNNERLEVFIVSCENLTPADTKRLSSNPYVKTYLLPDKSISGKRKTKVKKSTLNPVFKQTLAYDHIGKDELDKRTLLVSVWHADSFAKNVHIGEVRLPLNTFDFTCEQSCRYELGTKQEELDAAESTSKGCLSLSLMFETSDPLDTVGRLKCIIRSGSELKSPRPSVKPNAFVKLYLYPDPKRVTKQKTLVLKQDSNPNWNTTFVYENLSSDSLSDKSLELTVWHRESLRSNEFLGGLRFNLATGMSDGRFVEWMDATDQEAQLWRSALSTPNTWFNGVFQLRSNMQSRSAQFLM